MADIWTAKKRSYVMSRIRSKNTKPEKQVRSIVHSMGYRFRLHKKGLPGRPDIVLPKYKSVILVHGCFWHQHRGCIDGKLPKTRTNYWQEKMQRNIERDKLNNRRLRAQGWRVLTIWECQVEKNPGRVMERIYRFLEKSAERLR
jgi:DNA mismatch endonuclease (patch repair protein)